MPPINLFFSCRKAHIAPKVYRVLHIANSVRNLYRQGVTAHYICAKHTFFIRYSFLFIIYLFDYSAADYYIAVVEYCRLAAGGGALGGSKLQKHLALTYGVDNCLLFAVAVAEFRLCL